MNKNILIKGLIAGAIVSTAMLTSMSLCYVGEKMESSMVVGYASMIISLVFVFFGVKKERDNNNGLITFGKALKTGLLISFIASTLYVVSWVIDYYVFIPDFMERYSAMALKEAADNNLPAAELAEKTAEIEKYKLMYKNPFWVVVLTYLEILPVGLIMSLVAALVFRKTAKPQTA